MTKKTKTFVVTKPVNDTFVAHMTFDDLKPAKVYYDSISHVEGRQMFEVKGEEMVNITDTL